MYKRASVARVWQKAVEELGRLRAWRGGGERTEEGKEKGKGKGGVWGRGRGKEKGRGRKRGEACVIPR